MASPRWRRASRRAPAGTGRERRTARAPPDPRRGGANAADGRLPQGRRGGGMKRLVLVVLGALLVGFGGLGTVGYLSSREHVSRAKVLTGQIDTAKSNIAALRAKNIELDEQRAALDTERDALSDRVQGLDRQLEEMVANLEGVRGTLSATLQDHERLDGEQARLQSELEFVRAERDAAQAAAEHASAEVREMERDIRNVRSQLAMYERDYRKSIEHLERGSEPPPVTGVEVLADSSQGPKLDTAALMDSVAGGAVELATVRVEGVQASPVHGRLIEVNDQHQFVVVNRGSKDGVRIGTIFDVLRASLPVGQVRTIRVRNRLAACDVLTGEAMRVGDLAVQAER
ncbi:MAG TPA: hypothetical protein VGB20_01155 [bacterium]